MSSAEMVTTGVHFAAIADQEVFPFRPVRMHDGAPMHPTFSDHFVIGKIIVEPELLLQVANDISELTQQVTAEKIDTVWKTEGAPLSPRLESFIESCSALIHEYVMAHEPMIPIDTRQTAVVGPYEYNSAGQWHRDNGNDPHVTTFHSTLFGAPMAVAEGWFKKRHFRGNDVIKDVQDTISPGRGWVIATNGLTTIHRSPIKDHINEARLTTALEVRHAPLAVSLQ
jgi:hypothetical protein